MKTPLQVLASENASVPYGAARAVAEPNRAALQDEIQTLLSTERSQYGGGEAGRSAERAAALHELGAVSRMAQHFGGEDDYDSVRACTHGVAALRVFH